MTGIAHMNEAKKCGKLSLSPYFPQHGTYTLARKTYIVLPPQSMMWWCRVISKIDVGALMVSWRHHSEEQFPLLSVCSTFWVPLQLLLLSSLSHPSLCWGYPFNTLSLIFSLPLHKIDFLFAAHFKDIPYGSPAIHTTTCNDCRAANGQVQLIWPGLSRIRSLDSR